uniref:Cytochrome P450 n=1 Tax=Panagrolaimus sp. PS1159 TaxID=55785 RepID=A0AC35FMF3_9BILA
MVFILLFTLAVLWIFYNCYWKRYGLPPGPMPLPLIGNMAEFNRDPSCYKLFSKWEKKYGPIFTYWQGEEPIIAITDYDLIVEAFVKNGDATSDRHTKFLHNYSRLFRGSEPRGLFATPKNSKQNWEEHRKFLMQYIKKINFGEIFVLDEIETIFEKLQSSLNSGLKEHDVGELIDIAIASIIQQILFGHRFNDDEKIKEYKNLQNILMEHFGSWFKLCNIVVLIWPEILKHIPILNKDFSTLLGSGNQLYEYHETQIKKHQNIHENAFQNDSNIEDATDFIDAFLRQRSRNLELFNDEGEFSMEQLRAISFDFWVATLVTATQIKYNIIMLIRNPKIQEKIQQELDQICGNGRIEARHKPDLPYTNAALNMLRKTRLRHEKIVSAQLALYVNELRRLGCFAINPVPARQTRIPIVIGGYTIPAETAIHPVFSSVLLNEKYFPKPNEFIPERFLSQNESNINKLEYLIGFGLGKRQCLGEPLSKIEDFLITANLIHQFKFFSIDPTNPPSDEKVFGVAVSLKEKFKCKIVPRLT